MAQTRTKEDLLKEFREVCKVSLKKDLTDCPEYFQARIDEINKCLGEK